MLDFTYYVVAYITRRRMQRIEPVTVAQNEGKMAANNTSPVLTIAHTTLMTWHVVQALLFSHIRRLDWSSRLVEASRNISRHESSARSFCRLVAWGGMCSVWSAATTFDRWRAMRSDALLR